jgi:hypothetical protein
MTARSSVLALPTKNTCQRPEEIEKGYQNSVSPLIDLAEKESGI